MVTASIGYVVARRAAHHAQARATAAATICQTRVLRGECDGWRETVIDWTMGRKRSSRLRGYVRDMRQARIVARYRCPVTGHRLVVVVHRDPGRPPLTAIQEAAARIFPHDEASQTDMVSHAWERWERNGVRDVALLIHAGKHFAFRMRKKERSPLSWPMEDLDKCISACKPDTWPQELISGLPDHLRIVATLLAAGHNRAECARLLETSKATIWRQCNEIRAYIEPLV